MAYHPYHFVGEVLLHPVYIYIGPIYNYYVTVVYNVNISVV